MAILLIPNKYWYKLTMDVQRLINTILLHIQVYLVINVCVRRSDHNKKQPQWIDTEFGTAIEWKSDGVASLVYII